MLPTTMIGETIMHAIDYYQQKKKATRTPPPAAIPPSNNGPRLSVLIPFRIEVSFAIALVSTPDEWSLLSNHPMFF